FVAVVDPGVGGSRRILAARYSGRVVLAPDNGLVTMLHRDAELEELRFVESRRYFAAQISNTFHGRDIFAPVAAHLSRGVPLSQLGPPADRIEVLNVPRPVLHPDGGIEGQVLTIDRFGNLITNISDIDLSAARSPHRGKPYEVTLGEQVIGPLRVTYGEVAPGSPLALIGSARLLEIAVNGGSAAERFSAGVGASVRLR
ncbi:MAG: SAM-dependent chlorinase/fluorinase, partial [Phycisphaerae bacterium]